MTSKAKTKLTCYMYPAQRCENKPKFPVIAEEENQSKYPVVEKETKAD